jgi:radical SAM superfamily enzyme YgiQ (UPF0313 family)
MAGLPGETEEDIEQIADLSLEIALLRKKVCNRVAQVTAAVSWFVPKPHTPFAWLNQQNTDYFEKAKSIILTRKRKLAAKFVQFKFHDINRSILESAIGRGDRRLADVIEYAFRNGSRFDLWDEFFDYSLWQKSFDAFGLNLEEYAQRSFSKDEILPWQHLGGPEKDYLLSHLKKTDEL